MSREAMQMALEALEDANDVARMEFSDEDYYSEAINALRKALETEQEPVGRNEPGPTAWRCQCGKAYTVTCISSKPPKREWVGLTNEEIEHIADSEWEEAFVRMIEAKLKEKNT